MLYFFLFLSFGYSVRVLSTLLHELGHALPALYYTKEHVSIYLGGNVCTNKTIVLKLKRLIVYINYRDLVYRGGLCVHEGLLGRRQNIVVLFSGVLLTLVVALLSFFIFTNYVNNLYIQIFSFLLCISALIDVFYNLIPSSIPIKLEDGTITFNDGYQIKNLLFKRSLNDVLNLFNTKQYHKALQILERFKAQDYSSDAIYKIQTLCYFQLDRWDRLIEWIPANEERMSLDEDEYKILTYAYSQKGLFNEALDNSNKGLQFFPFSASLKYYSILSMFNLKQFENVIEKCDEIGLENEFEANLYALKGVSLLELDKADESLICLVLAERKHQEVFDNFEKFIGIAYWKNNKRIEAQYHLNKAYEIDANDVDVLQYLDLVYKDIKLE